MFEAFKTLVNWWANRPSMSSRFLEFLALTDCSKKRCIQVVCLSRLHYDSVVGLRQTKGLKGFNNQVDIRLILHSKELRKIVDSVCEDVRGRQCLSLEPS